MTVLAIYLAYLAKEESVLPENFRVGVLLYHNLMATSVTTPIEMLRTAEAAARGRGTKPAPLEIHFISPSGSPVLSAADFHLAATHTLAEAGDYQLIILPSLWRNPRPALRDNADYLPWLTDQSRRGALITAVGTGCCFMAEAGLLNGKPATTHWHYFEQFQKAYPQVNLRRQYFITQEGNLYCAASINAMAELMVHIISRIYGIRNSFDPPRYLAEQVEYHPDETIVQAQIWLEDNFAKPVQIHYLAKHMGMSVRSFNRRFKNALNQVPLAFLQKIRLSHARELLQQTDLAIGEVAAQCGYQDMAFFSRQFRKHYGTPPREYRKTVRAKLFSRQ